MKHFIDGDVIYFDTETTGLNSWRGDAPFAFSFSNRNLDKVYFEFQVNPFTRQPIVDRLALKRIAALLEDERILKVGHNLKFDVRMVDKAYGIKVRGPGGLLTEGGQFGDTMFMAHACNTLEPDYKLKRLGRVYADIPTSDEKDLHNTVVRMRRRASKLGWQIAWEISERPNGEIKKKGAVAADYWLPNTMHRLRPDLATPEDAATCENYAVFDVIRTAMLDLMYQDLMDEIGVRHTYEFEQRVWPVIYRMEERGVKIDPENLAKEIQDCLVRQARLMPEIMKVAWPGFNIDSHDDLRELLYSKKYLGLSCRKDRRTKTGLPSVDVDALNDHKGNPVIQTIMRHRGAGKAFGFFHQYQRLMMPDPLVAEIRRKLLGLECEEWMVLHPDFRQLGPCTGRLSCANPNVQQVTSIESSRSAEPIDGRHSFGPRPGYVWLHIDYKGMEVVVFAFVSEEPNMLQAIREGRSIHHEVANRGWGGPWNEAGITECIHVLGLDGSELGTNAELRVLWKEWGITDWRKLTDKNRRDLACLWLQRFNWDIVKAQESIGKKVTVNKGKMVTFAKVYGGGPDAIKDLLHVTLEEARDFLATYDRAFPRITEYSRELTAQARLDGCVYSLWDRRMTVNPDKAYRCVNYKVQGSCADLLKTAMVKSDRWLREAQRDAYLIMSIHDELVFEVAKSEFTYPLIGRLSAIMQDTEGRIGVPMDTDPSVVYAQWAHKKKLKVTREYISMN